MTAAALCIAMLAAAGAPNCPPGNTNPACANNVNKQHDRQQEELLKEKQAEQQRAQQQQAEQQRRSQEEHAREQDRLLKEKQAEQQREQQQRAQQGEQQRRSQEEHAREQDRLLKEKQAEQQRAQQQQGEQQRRSQEEHAREQDRLLKEKQAEQQREQQQRGQQGEQQRRAQEEHEREQERLMREKQQEQRGPQRPPPPGRGPEYAQPGRPPPPGRNEPVRPRPVQLRTGTTVVARPQQRGVSITHREKDGSELVVRTHVRPDGVRSVTGYRLVRDPAAGTQTRQYSNGARVITAREYVARTTPAGITYTRHNDGLRECTGHDGKPVFHERYRAYTAPDGRQGQAIERTVYVRTWRGRVERLQRPFVETYRPVWYGGGVYYSYVPTVYQPVYYRPFYTPFPRPIVVAAACIICPTPVVVWEQPVVRYVDPVALLADLVITSAIDDAVYADAPPPQADANTVALQQQVYSLQQEVDTEAQSNEELRAQLSEQQMEMDAVRAQQDQGGPPAPPPPPPPMQVPEDARQQLRSQVQQDLSLHQQQQPLMVPDVIASADAQNYVFQISDPLDVTDAQTDEECNVTTGDLVRFAAVPAPDAQFAQMTVVTSRQGSCRAGSVISVSLNDLQQMLNAFNQRLEQNMSRVHDQVAGR